jgi:hypothetical protein
VTCLRWTERGLYGCLAQAEQGFELGLADDAEFSLDVAQPFTPLLDLRRVLPLSCGADTSAAACASDPNYGWPLVCDKLGADCNYEDGASGAGGEPGQPAPSGGEGGVPTQAGGSGPSGRGGDRVEDGKPQGTPAREKSSDGGCGCRTSPGTATLAWPALWLILTQVARRRRTRTPYRLDTKAQ